MHVITFMYRTHLVSKSLNCNCQKIKDSTCK